MLKLDGNDMYISHGDTLDITFRVGGYKLQPTDKVIFSVKNTANSSEILISKTITNFPANSVHVIIPASEMGTLPIGKKVYDLLCVSGDKKTTFNFPASLIIMGVVHNE